MPHTIEIDDELFAWLESRARPFVDRPLDVLRRELGLEPALPAGTLPTGREARGEEEDALARYLQRRGVMPHVRELWSEVDQRLREIDSTYRATIHHSYVGYSLHGRVRCSLVPRKTRLQVVLDRDPGRFAGLHQVRSLRDVGHHGYGNLEFRVDSRSDLDVLFQTFGAWFAGQDEQA